MSTGVRLFFNGELAGLRTIANAIPRDADVKLFVADVHTKTFGPDELNQVPAWIPAERGGYIENDLSQYFQLPLQRRPDVARPSDYSYLVTRGSYRQARKAVGSAAKLVKSDQGFFLFELGRPEVHVPGLRLVRFGQEWRAPRQDRTVGGAGLTVAGRVYSRGIGTHARSALELRETGPVRRLRGLVGIDDEVDTPAVVGFRIVTSDAKTLWSSGAMHHGDPARPFDVDLGEIHGDLFLVTDSIRVRAGAHADWLDLEGVPTAGP